MIKTSKPLSHVNRSDLLSSNDEIKRNICQPDTTLQSLDNEFYITENTTLEAQTNVQSVLDAFLEQFTSVVPAPDQIEQQMPSLLLSNSLRFVHDVQPYQKTQHNTDNSNEYSDKNLAPYVIRIQGIKTNADKGNSVLPRLQARI